jgi:hypothetical protein
VTRQRWCSLVSRFLPELQSPPSLPPSERARRAFLSAPSFPRGALARSLRPMLRTRRSRADVPTAPAAKAAAAVEVPRTPSAARALLEQLERGGRAGRRGNKYGVAPKGERTFEGFLFDSKAELHRFQELELLRRSGEVRLVLRQVPFHLPGGVRYVLDFLVVWADGRLSFEDVKGHRTKEYLAKKKMVEAIHRVTIEERAR